MTDTTQVTVVDSVKDSGFLNVVVFQTPVYVTADNYDSAWLQRELNPTDGWNFSVPTAMTCIINRWDDVKIAGDPTNRTTPPDEFTQPYAVSIGKQYEVTWNKALVFKATGKSSHNADDVEILNSTTGAPSHQFIDVQFLKNGSLLTTVRACKGSSPAVLALQPAIYFGWNTAVEKGDTWASGNFSGNSTKISLVDSTGALVPHVTVTMTQDEAGGVITWTPSYTDSKKASTPLLDLFTLHARAINKQLDLLSEAQDVLKKKAVVRKAERKRVGEAVVWSTSVLLQEGVLANIEDRQAVTVSGLAAKDWDPILQKVHKDKECKIEVGVTITPADAVALMAAAGPFISAITPLGLAFLGIVGFAAYRAYKVKCTKGADGSWSFELKP